MRLSNTLVDHDRVLESGLEESAWPVTRGLRPGYWKVSRSADEMSGPARWGQLLMPRSAESMGDAPPRGCSNPEQPRHACCTSVPRLGHSSQSIPEDPRVGFCVGPWDNGPPAAFSSAEYGVVGFTRTLLANRKGSLDHGQLDPCPAIIMETAAGRCVLPPRTVVPRRAFPDHAMCNFASHPLKDGRLDL